MQSRKSNGVADRSVSERGFTCYDALTDTYGAVVQVIQSSAARFEGDEDGPWVWIFVDGGEVTGNRGSAHLGPAAARRVRDALDVWLTEEADV